MKEAGEGIFVVVGRNKNIDKQGLELSVYTAGYAPPPPKAQ
jgi:hypothetical protein